MNTFNLESIIRENIKRLVPYSSARSEYNGDASIFLDANENSFGSPILNGYNRYPDPLQNALKEKISAIKGIPANKIFLGNGSDEAIDLLIRATCYPSRDNILVLPPTYGMYEVAAKINDVLVKKINLTANFQPDVTTILNAIDNNTKLIFICTPNNPTGNSIDRSSIEMLLKSFKGLLIVDEAYIDFADEVTWIQQLNNYPNLVVLQTLSKAWGLAGLRVGAAYASTAVIDVLNKIKAPYNISIASQELALKALKEDTTIQKWINTIKQQRQILSNELRQFSFISEIYQSQGNFILVKVANADALYRYLLQQNIVVRNRSNLPLCSNCLRITVGTPIENNYLLTALKEYNND